MKKYAEIDSTEFPIIKVAFTGEAATEKNFPKYLEELKANYAAKQEIAIIFDASRAVIPGINYQKMQAQWLKENEQLMKDYCRGTAYVIPNLIIKNVLKAIFAIQKQPVPYKVCSTNDKAYEWAKAQLESANT